MKAHKKKAKTKTQSRAKAKRAKGSTKPVRHAAKVKAKARISKKAVRKPPKSARKKSAAKASVPKPTVIAPANSTLLGYVDDYFAKIGVIALELLAPVSAGAHLQVIGFTTHFDQTLDSMQIDHQPVTIARAKDSVGIKVAGRARRGDHVYLIHPLRE